MKQRFGAESFLVARPAGSPKLVAKAALHATFEALLLGAGCSEVASSAGGPSGWFLDVGTDDDELLALASSVGCGVAVLDPQVKDVRAVEMTRCMNEEPNRPFAVFQVQATNITDPETLANITHIDLRSASDSEPASLTNRSKSALLGMLNRLEKPTMLNLRPAAVPVPKEEKGSKTVQKKRLRKKPHSKPLEPAPANGTLAHIAVHSSAEGLAPNASSVSSTPDIHTAPIDPTERGVMLDSLFARPSASNSSDAVDVATPEGANVSVGKIALLKVTPRNESDDTLRALQGARGLVESGRVKCLVTEMNFDMSATESFIAFVTDMERLGFHFAHLGSLDYSELEVTDQGTYEVFHTDAKQLQELFDTYKRIRSFDERSGFRVYSGSLSLDRNGHYFDYTDLVFACKGDFPSRLSVLPKGKIRFRNGVWWLEKSE